MKQLSFDVDGGLFWLTVDKAKEIQSEVMRVAHSLKQNGQSHIDSECVDAAIDIVGERLGVNGKDLWSHVVATNMRKSNPEDNNHNIDKRLSDLIAKQKNELDELLAKLENDKKQKDKEKENKSKYFLSEYISVKPYNAKKKSIHHNYRIKGKPGNIHVMYCDKLWRANRIAENIDKIIRANLSK